ncbi:uncharacterized protein RHIMIDRAFT_283748 [Rhizopus microsporus ATCC 52813]|uniref:Uncharacterized protein n=1 Tax=Rhizopus microsporus ATCC 52813 TaxID=1340429 RepID=A0A2G4STB0_RHIZD|nr:uncharacterized protein RHIMIDRAFT_283748 [Rhizopus microsporus ATCC 52813]PHZ11985.1 hypothetical protein RHIMIDRAFT_283748 [Rhizopus microsporus ATCC 52813]
MHAETCFIDGIAATFLILISSAFHSKTFFLRSLKLLKVNLVDESPKLVKEI